MLRNYLRIALRNFFRHKTFSLINIAGLTIGMASSVLIMLWVQDELNYDQFHLNKDNIYRTVIEGNVSGSVVRTARSPFAMAPALKKDFPEVLYSSSYRNIGLPFSYQNKSFLERGGVVGPDFLSIFTFLFKGGNRKDVLKDPYSLVISEKMAKKIFGNENPVGKTLEVSEKWTFKVDAVIEDIPHNSHLHFEFLISTEFLKSLGWRFDVWNNINNPVYTYITLKENTNREQFDQKIAGLIKKHVPESSLKPYTQSLDRIHLYSDFAGDLKGHGDIKYVIIFSLMAVFLLIIACVNFMNLTTARSGNRANEVGMRKVVGAKKKHLIFQFLGEAVTFSLLALTLSVLVVLLFLPVFNELSGKKLVLDLIGNYTAVLGLVGIAILTGIMAGGYPAIFFSSFHPVKVLKGASYSGTHGSFFRKALVVFQFSISIVMIISSLVVSKQLNFIQNKKLGFEKEHLIYVEMNEELNNNFESLKNNLLKNPNITNIALASHLLTDVTHIHGKVEWEGMNPDEKFPMNCILVNHDFVKTMKMEIVQGRDFSKTFATDESQGFIINETALKKMGLDTPVGKKITYGHDKGRIIGIIRDFHFKPLRNEIEPVILKASGKESFYMYIRLNSNDMSATFDYLRKTWESYSFETSFDYKFLSDTIGEMYQMERKVNTIFNYFTYLAIFISCLGLFGLSSYIVERRTKEIGIRKVLGASVPRVVLYLSSGYSKWVLTANIIAWPIAYYSMGKWLENFAYRIEVDFGILAFAGILAIGIAFITISYHTIKAASANPVKALKYQ